MTTKERIDALMRARNILHKQEKGEQIASYEIIIAHDIIDQVVDDMIDERFRTVNNKRQ